MKALVLERQQQLSLCERPAPGTLGAHDVRIRIHTVGICGSDVHYYTHGRIGPYVVSEPMILGHEASGTIVEVGSSVVNLKVDDRVCMEPGIPNPNSRAAKLGIYNVDPEVRFWATPPIDGCLCEEVIHPAAYTYRLPDSVNFKEGAMVEPFAIGMQAATRARIKPGDTVAVIGAGPIGMMIALAAMAGGASRVIISDLADLKLKVTEHYPGLIPVHVTDGVRLSDRVAELTAGWGADVVFEASGSPRATAEMLASACPGGAVVLVGIPFEPIALDVAAVQAKELRIESVFRYANMYARAIDLIASGKVNLRPLITATYPLKEAVKAFERAASARPGDIKLLIAVEQK